MPQEKSVQQQRIYNFVKDQKYAVVSTVNEAGQPESALVAFSETDSLELIFATGEHTRKVQNLLLNPNVAVVIGWDPDELTTVQYEGVARVLPMEMAGEYAGIHYEKQPGSREHQDKPGECFVVISPVWARYTDFGNHPEEIFEEHFGID
jgi:pyridoxine/pyridoxamine 5'-phosphate oxidase